MRPTSLLIFTVLLFVPQISQAVPVRIDFTGTVTNTGDSFAPTGPNLGADSPFTLGQSFTGYAVYESSTPVSGSGATNSSHADAVVEFSVSFAGLGNIFWDSSLVSNTAIQKTNANIIESSDDVLTLTTLNNAAFGSPQAHNGDPSLVSFASSFPGSSTDWNAYRMLLNIRGGDLTVGSLPDAPYDHTPTFPGNTDLFALQYSNFAERTTGGFSLFVANVRGSVDSAVFSTPGSEVPEPGTAALLGAGLIGLYFRRKHLAA